MFHTGLSYYENTTVENFTTDIGIKLRRRINGPWRGILKVCTKRKIIIEEYPNLEKNKVYVFVANHSFDEDIISALSAIDRNVYMLHGTTDQMRHNPVFLAMWLNGMIYVNRLKSDSRRDAIEKMKRILSSGSSVLLFPEGGYNNTENQLIMPLFASPYYLSKDLGVKVVPLITFSPLGSKVIYIRAEMPMDLSVYPKHQALNVLRDCMCTTLWEMLETHGQFALRSSLPEDPRLWWLEQRKNVYDCQKWHADVWDEELTCYCEKGSEPPSEIRHFIDRVNVNNSNAWIFSELLVKRQEDIKYDLKSYLRKTIKIQK